MTSSHSNAIFTDDESEDFSDNEQRQRSISYSDQHQTTDDENTLLSAQSSPSPFAFSADDLSSNEQNLPEDEDMQEENYLDPDLYCLRRSNRQKDKSSPTVSLYIISYYTCKKR